jgi:hypothetical protein
MEKILLSASLAAILAVCAACTVKEDRDFCPCSLTVSFSDPDASGPVELLAWDSETVFRDQVLIEDCRPEWTKSVRKGVFILSAYKGAAGSSIPMGHIIRIPTNCQADSLYAYFEKVEATGDRAHANVVFRKQFATVFLDIPQSDETIHKCRFLVEGNSCGFDVLDFSPIAGSFLFKPAPVTGETVITFRIPRQADDSLMVTVYPEDSPEARFPLGEYIRQLGYDWKSDDLQDIYLSIDLVRGVVDLRIADWEEGTVFPLVEQ